MLNTRFRPILLLLGLMAGAGNLRAQTIEDSILVPGAWVGSLAYNSQEDVVYGASEQGFFFAISAESNRVIASYPLNGAFVVAYDSVDNKAYVTYHGTEVESLAVIDGATHQIIKRIEMPGSTNPVWDPVNDRVYVSCQFTNSVAVVDCATDSLLMYIPVGVCPIKMYVNTLRQKLYVLGYDFGEVSIIDMATNQVIKTIDVGQVPNAGHYSRRMDKFYCPGEFGEVVAIDGATDLIVARIPVRLNSLIFSLAGNDAVPVVLAGVGDQHSYLYAIDARADTVTSSLQIPGAPYGLLYNPATFRFFCGNCGRGSVSVLAGDGSSITGTLSLGDDPYVLLRVPKHDRIYVGDLGRRWVYSIHDTFQAVRTPQYSTPDTVTGLHLEPNPFGSRLSVWCGPGIVSEGAAVWSEDGRLVRSLAEGGRGENAVRLVWDGKDNNGRSLPAGVYFVAAGRGACAKAVKQR